MQDMLEILSYYRDHPLPDEESQRILLLNQLTNYDLFYIYYEDVCKYSQSFKEHYPEERLRSIFRACKITGNDVQYEINHCNASEEDKALMRFFFKGKVI